MSWGLLPSAAAPAETSLEEVFTALHLTREPTDYVLVIDTSASMADKQDRYGKVRSGLSRMAKSLNPADRVALITFDSTATLRRPLTPVGSDPGAIVSALPGSPSGQATDIGRGVSSALALMQHSNLRSRAAVLLFTDGKIDTDKNSPYATVSSPGWTVLRQQASALQSAHDIAPLAIALASNTDAAVLKQVFSNVINVSSGDLGSYLSQVSTEVMKAAAIGKLKGPLSDPVRVSFEGLPEATGSTTGRAKLVLHNDNPLVPVTVTKLRLQPGTVKATGLPPSVAIPAGGTTTTEFTLDTTPAAGSTVDITLSGVVDTPWHSVIVNDLGLPWPARLVSATGRVGAAPMGTSSPPISQSSTPTTRPRWPIQQVAEVLAVVVLLTFGAFAVRAFGRTRGPQLVGTLTILRNGRVVDERLLRGHTSTFTLTESGTKLSLRGTRSAAGEPGIKVTGSAGKEHGSGTLFEGDMLAFNGLEITYTSDRTRMLRLIGTD